jgi:uncharacterized protein (DUF1501 family)
MKRRELIRNLAFASVAASAGSLVMPSRAMAICSSYPNLQRTLVNVMLQGGVDTRFIFMPAPGSLPKAGHELLMWEARRNMYRLAGESLYPDYETMFDLEYLLVPASGLQPAFGIHRSCSWLHQEFEKNRVAIIANAVCSTNRRHDQSIINAEAADPSFGELDQDRDGWGGRLMDSIGGNATAVEIGGSISVFNKGTDPSNRLSRVVHAQDTRKISLPSATSGDSTKPSDVVTRALKSYYAGRTPEVAAGKPADWPFHRFFDQNAAFRELGGQMEQRIGECGDFHELLRSSGGGDFNLGSNSFEQQCRNLHDICQAADILNVRSVSMSYGGWDTHGNQEARISRNLSDILGSDKGLDRTVQAISDMDSNAADQLVFYFATDFGRQLVTNGDFGTDHGRGLYSILYGRGVQGGVYGEMFPESETEDQGGSIPLQRHGADIAGLTSTERIISEICEWMHPGSSETVVPGAGNSSLETGVLLDQLFI